MGLWSSIARVGVRIAASLGLFIEFPFVHVAMQLQPDPGNGARGLTIHTNWESHGGLPDHQTPSVAHVLRYEPTENP